MRGAYRTVLGRRDVLSALVPYVLARLPLTMAPLALLLLTQAQSGSYHRAGLVCGAYAVGAAATAPLLGRLVDRRGQSPVLLVTGVVHMTAMVVAAYVAGQRAFPLLIVAAAVAGGSVPPVAACMRVLWSRMLPDEKARKVGYAIEGVVVEVAELSGPLLITVLLVLGRPAVAVALSGLLMGGASLVFRASRVSREVPPAMRAGDRWGPLAVRGVRRLLLVISTSTASIGALEVTVTAFARHHGGLASAGLYIGVISAGGIIAGLAFGGSDRLSYRGPGMLTVMLLLSAASIACVAEAAAPALMLVGLFVFGATVSVGVVLQLGLMANVATDELRTEAFTWGGTANFVGLGLGTSLAGWAVDRLPLTTAFFLTVTPMVLAAVITMASRTSLTAADGHDRDDVHADVASARLAVAPDVAALAEELAALRRHVTDLESALQSALLDSPAVVVEDARERARRMLDRADAACLEMRERATDDAARVRSAATTASLEILAAAERDARAMLDQARREADRITSRARRTAAVGGTSRPALTALPGGDDADGVAAGS